MGTNDQWEAATMGFQNIGANYWKGEEGRKALIAGKQKFTDPQYVAVFETLAKWAPYMGSGFKAQTYPDSQNLFSLGKAAIYPAGSWDIATFRAQASFDLGVFKPPLPKGATDCYISDHTDIGIGIKQGLQEPGGRQDLPRMDRPPRSSPTSSPTRSRASSRSPARRCTLKDDVAQSFVSWRGECKSTIRNSYQILSRGTPNLENDLWNVSAQVINGTLTPQAAAKQAQDGLDKWYKPAK